MKISYIIQEPINYDETEESETLTAEENSASKLELEVWVTFFFSCWTHSQ